MRWLALLAALTIAACAARRESVRLVVLPDGGVEPVSENVTHVAKQKLADGGTVIDVVTE